MQAEMVEALKADGWKPFQPQPNDEYVLRGYKFFDTPTHCALNHDKPGIQVECAVWQFPVGEPRLQISLSGEAPDGNWPHLAMTVERLEEVEPTVRRLLATWEFIANWKEEKSAHN